MVYVMIDTVLEQSRLDPVGQCEELLAWRMNYEGFAHRLKVKGPS